LEGGVRTVDRPDAGAGAHIKDPLRVLQRGKVQFPPAQVKHQRMFHVLPILLFIVVGNEVSPLLVFVVTAIVLENVVADARRNRSSDRRFDVVEIPLIMVDLNDHVTGCPNIRGSLRLNLGRHGFGLVRPVRGEVRTAFIAGKEAPTGGHAVFWEGLARILNASWGLLSQLMEAPHQLSPDSYRLN